MKRINPRMLAGLPVLAVGVFAGIISYNDILNLALTHGQAGIPARLLPLTVDLLIVAGSVILLWPAGESGWLGWLGVGPGVGATIFANIESQLPHGWLSATVAAWAAIALTLATFMFERWLKAQIRPVSATPATVQPPAGQVAGEVAEGGRQVADTAADPACGHVLFGDPERDVQTAYVHSRDCLGETPSIRQLAAAHGLSRYKVGELVGPLNGHGELEAAD